MQNCQIYFFVFYYHQNLKSAQFYKQGAIKGSVYAELRDKYTWLELTNRVSISIASVYTGI